MLESIDFSLFRPACIAHTVAVLLHGCWAVYDPPLDLPLVCHTPYNIGNNNIVRTPRVQVTDGTYAPRHAGDETPRLYIPVAIYNFLERAHRAQVTDETYAPRHVGDVTPRLYIPVAIYNFLERAHRAQVTDETYAPRHAGDVTPRLLLVKSILGDHARGRLLVSPWSAFKGVFPMQVCFSMFSII